MNTAYRAGSWYLLIGPRAVVALPPDAASALVAQLWARVGSADVAFSDVVDALTAAGGGTFSAIPPFAAIVREGSDARIAVRGRVSARVVGSTGEHEITGAEVTTWSERFVPSVAGAEVVVEDAQDDVALPIVAGVVRASRVGFGSVLEPTPEPVSVPEPVEVTSPEAAPVPEPVEGTPADPEPDPLPEPVEEPEPEPVPEPIAPAVEAPTPDADLPVMDVPVPNPADHDDVEDTVMSPSSPNAVPVETILPPADTISPPLGGHTLDLRPVGGAEQQANEVYDDEGDEGDHDGATISVAQARALRGTAPDPIPSSPSPAAPETDASTGPRIRMSTGQIVALDRTVVIGRRPRATRSSGATLPHLIAVDSPQQDISRSHLEIRPESDAVVVLDLHTTNGSTLLRPGADPVRLHPGEQTIVVTGDVIDLGDGVTVAFEDLP
jgi:hypothetical protein